MLHSAIEAYEKGCIDGMLTAEQMRWQGTPMGKLLKGLFYRPLVPPNGCATVLSERVSG